MLIYGLLIGIRNRTNLNAGGSASQTAMDDAQVSGVLTVLVWSCRRGLVGNEQLS